MDVSFWMRLIVTKKNTVYNEMSFFDVQQSLDTNNCKTTNRNSNHFHKTPKNMKKKVRFSNDIGPAYPNRGNIHERLQTFKRLSWPPGISQNPYDLAHAGFFYTGNNRIFSRICISILPLFSPYYEFDKYFANFFIWC